jgi:predicted permease
VAFLRSCLTGLWSLFHKERVSQEMDEELRSYLDAAVAERMNGGVSYSEALRAAKVEMGNLETVKQQIRSSVWESAVDSLAADFRYSLRVLAKSPGFTAVAILSLALGVGANTAIFTLVNDLMLKKLPVRQPDQLVSFGDDSGCCILGTVPLGTAGLFSYDFYREIKKQHEFFQDISGSAGFTLPAGVRLREGSAEPAGVAFLQLVSGNYFSVLGVQPALGRPILPSDEDIPGRNPVAVLSYHYWQTNLAGDPAVIGRSITVDETPFTVIGVAPPRFFGVKVEAQAPDLWLPLTMQKEVMEHSSLLDARGLYWLHLMGRRNAGMNMNQAQEWFDAQVRQYMRDLKGSQLTPDRIRQIQRISVRLTPGARGGSDLREQYKAPLGILMGVVALVLLIACANLANLLLAKAVSREREISTRLALGSSRARIIRQVLIETLLLSLGGGALGVILAFSGTRALINFVVAGSTYTVLDPKPDIYVLTFTFGISLLTGTLFGMAPALRVSRVSVAPALKANARTTASGGRAPSRLIPKLLVAGQVTLSLMLLVGAGLFLRTLRNLESQDLGFESHNLLLVQILPEAAGYLPPQLSSLYDRILDRVDALPGVRSATLSSVPVINPGQWGSPISIAGYTAKPDEAVDTVGNQVSSRYFETVGITVLIGRPIGPQDTAASTKVVVVNQTFAENYFPKGQAIGRTFTIADPGAPGTWQIVGVVRDAKYSSARETPQRMIYLPLVQIAGRHVYAHSLQLRTVGDPADVREEVRRAFAQVDPNLAILKMETISQQLNHLMDQEQLISQLSNWFAMLALLLTSIGLYGVMTYNVARRTNEIGIRMALGAQNREVLWMVLKESLFLVGAGILLGVPATIAATRLVGAQLFGLSSLDPITFVVAILTISLVTLLAAYFPARRATRVDPVVALRDE